MTAATIMAALTNSKGQWSRVKSAIRGNPQHASGDITDPRSQTLFGNARPRNSVSRLWLDPKQSFESSFPKQSLGTRGYCASCAAHAKASRGTSAPQLARASWPALARRGRDLGADVLEGVAGVGAQGADRGDAHHDDQGQHHGVLNRRRAVFVLQEVQGELTELTHVRLLQMQREAREIGKANPTKLSVVSSEWLVVS